MKCKYYDSFYGFCNNKGRYCHPSGFCCDDCEVRETCKTSCKNSQIFEEKNSKNHLQTVGNAL